MAKSKPPFYLGPYKVVSELGAGGFATVYKAVVEGDMGFSRAVALKVLHGHVVEDNPTVVMMLADEARLLARMQHPNIVYVQWFGQLQHPDEGTVFAMMMEHVEGRSFRSMMDDARAAAEIIPLSVMLDVHTDVARGLAFAHGLRDDQGAPLGLVHRDLKPDNVMISTHGAIKLLDFGIAKASDRLAEKTRTDMVRGTVHYMSPEQVSGQDLDFRSDLFSFGAMLFEGVARRRLIGAPTVMAALHEVATFDVERGLSRGGDLPPGIVGILRRTLAPRRADRYASTEQLVADLEELRASIRAPQATSMFLRERVAAAPPPAAQLGARGRRVVDPNQATEAVMGPLVEPTAQMESGLGNPFSTGQPGPGRDLGPALAAGPTRAEIDPTRAIDSRAIRAGLPLPPNEPPVRHGPEDGTLARPIPRTAPTSRGLPIAAALGTAALLVGVGAWFGGRPQPPVADASLTAVSAQTPAAPVSPEFSPAVLAADPTPSPMVSTIVRAAEPTPRKEDVQVAVANAPREPKTEVPKVRSDPTPAPTVSGKTPDPVTPVGEGTVRLTANRSFELVVNRRTYTTMEARRGIRLPSGRHTLKLECLDCPPGVESSVTVSAEVVAGQTAVLNEVQFTPASP